MTDLILHQQLPRAIAKEKDGLILYWVEELKVAGLHTRGLARLLDCQPDLISDTIKRLQGVGGITILKAETITPGGFQAVGLIVEDDLGEVLEAISLSKAKIETRKKAMQAMKQLAAAGFKLLVMLELAPRELKAQIDQHVSDIDKLLEIERLKIKGQEIDHAALTMHGDAWLAVRGSKIVEREKAVTEVLQPATGKIDKVMTADQLKRYVKSRTGQKVPSLKWFAEQLRAAGRDDLLLPVTRHTTTEHPDADKIQEALTVVYGKQRQRLIGE